MNEDKHISPMDKFSIHAGRLGTKILRMLPAETAHEIGISALSSPTISSIPKPNLLYPNIGLRTSVPGLGDLPHPIGLAAGFDKNCHAPEGFAHLGCSFVEVGTVTPRAQPGNPKPRLFRYPEQHALINRMGFNNDGALAVAKRLQNKSWDNKKHPLGINLGKNKDTPMENAIADYVDSFTLFKDLAKYFVINISSPNTPGLRNLASKEFITQLAEAFSGENKNIWIKLDPDMDKKKFQNLIQVITDLNFSGVILSNTHRVELPEAGGQSGHPVAIPSTRCLEWAWEVHQGQLPMIGVGGIMSGLDAYEKIIRGANALQVYTALVYRGPWAVLEILAELSRELKLRGIEHINDAFGTYYQ